MPSPNSVSQASRENYVHGPSVETRLGRRSSLTSALSNTAHEAENLGLGSGYSVGRMAENVAPEAATSAAATKSWLEKTETNFGEMNRSPSSFSVHEELDKWRKDPDLAVAVAAIKTLTAVIKRSEATTMMGLEKELLEASESLKERHRNSISLSAGCNLFLRYVTRTSSLEFESFEVGKLRLIERGERFSDISVKARETIAMLGQDFIRDGCTILTHGFSRVVLSLCRQAALCGKHFNVICTEGRPDNEGLKMANELWKFEIPVTLILDAAVAYIMEKVDMVLVGAEGVVESGGIIHTLGTYQVAVVARAMNKPVYVAAESYKFARLYPLDQRDLEPSPHPVDFRLPLPPFVTVENSRSDYTPPGFLTLLFTDLGVLTPSAVSDELIQLYL